MSVPYQKSRCSPTLYKVNLSILAMDKNLLNSSQSPVQHTGNFLAALHKLQLVTTLYLI